MGKTDKKKFDFTGSEDDNHLLVIEPTNHLRCKNCWAEICPSDYTILESSCAREEKVTTSCYGFQKTHQTLKKKKKGNRNLSISIENSNWHSTCKKNSKFGLTSWKKEREDIASSSKNLCGEHDKELEFWCNTCYTISCKICLNKLHKNCDWKLLEESPFHVQVNRLQKADNDVKSSNYFDSLFLLSQSLTMRMRGYLKIVRSFQKEISEYETSLQAEFQTLMKVRSRLANMKGQQNTKDQIQEVGKTLQAMVYMFQEPRELLWKIAKTYQDVKETEANFYLPDNELRELFGKALFSAKQDENRKESGNSLDNDQIKNKKEKSDLDPTPKQISLEKNKKLCADSYYSSTILHPEPQTVFSTVSSKSCCKLSSIDYNSLEKIDHLIPKQIETYENALNKHKEPVYAEPYDLNWKFKNGVDPIYTSPSNEPLLSNGIDNNGTLPLSFRTVKSLKLSVSDMNYNDSSEINNETLFDISHLEIGSNDHENSFNPVENAKFSENKDLRKLFTDYSGGIFRAPETDFNEIISSQEEININDTCDRRFGSELTSFKRNANNDVRKEIVRSPIESEEFIKRTKAPGSQMPTVVEVWDYSRKSVADDRSSSWSIRDLTNLLAHVKVLDLKVQLRFLQSFYYADHVNLQFEKPLYNFFENDMMTCTLTEVLAYIKPDLVLSSMPSTLEKLAVVISSPLEWKKIMRIWNLQLTRFRNIRQLHLRVSIYSGNGPDANDVRHAKALPVYSDSSSSIFDFENKTGRVGVYLHFVSLERARIDWMVEVMKKANRFARNFVSISSLTLCLPDCKFTTEDFNRLLHLLPDVSVRARCSLSSEDKSRLQNNYRKRNIFLSWSVGEVFRGE